MKNFSAEVKIIGINLFVFVPREILREIILEAGKSKGANPLKGKLNGKPFVQTLVKYSGTWQLYLNGDMRKTWRTKASDIVNMKIAVDFKPRVTPLHPELAVALRKNKPTKVSFHRSLHPVRKISIAT